ncbi:MAG: hypothetical protein LUG93_00395 [Lachnospiraceae bacterium]|nr:hypothetical protein [Lachnospiraceae bacterium]
MVKDIVKSILGNRISVWLKTMKYYSNNPECRNFLKDNEKYKNLYKGKRCFVLGNGPSLNSVDFSALSNEYTFTVNQLSRRADFDKLKTNFHIWVDTLFFDLNSDNAADMELLEVMKKVKTEGNSPVNFFKWEAHRMIEQYNLADELNIQYIAEVRYDDRSSILKRNVDFTRTIPWMESVTCYAICLAVYMGFKEIYLLGCDCTGFINIASSKMKQAENSVYAYNISSNEKERLERMFNKRRIRDELNAYVGLFDEYEVLGQYCKKNGVLLCDATDGGLIDCLPKVDLENVLFEKIKNNEN